MTTPHYTFLIMAGGTGGHIFPALAVAQTLQKRGHRCVWLGAEGAMETRLVPQYGIDIETLAIKGVRGNGLKRKLALPFTLSKAVAAARAVMLRHRVDAVIGFGGFASFPGGVAAKLLGKPLIIHEQNAVAGLSNKILAKVATRVLYAFPNALPYPDGLVGNPVRADIAALSPPQERFGARSGSLKVLIVGGSLGAAVFNERLPQIFAALPPEKRPHIFHQTGRNRLAEVQAAYAEAGVAAECAEFITDMVAAYAEADFVICRSGALTVAELAAAGLGGFLVPFPHAVDDHQTANAQYLVQVGAAECIPQPQLSADTLLPKLNALTRDTCLTWAQQARSAALPEAADRVADIALATLAPG